MTATAPVYTLSNDAPHHIENGRRTLRHILNASTQLESLTVNARDYASNEAYRTARAELLEAAKKLREVEEYLTAYTLNWQAIAAQK